MEKFPIIRTLTDNWKLFFITANKYMNFYLHKHLHSLFFVVGMILVINR